MLLCMWCHKLIDDNPGRYSRAELELQKAEHEGRIERLTALAPQMRTTVVRIKCRIGGHIVEVNDREICQALYPRYPSERRPLEIDLTELGDEKGGAFYELAADRIREQTGRWYVTGADLRKTGHLSVFGLAPLPLLVLLGSCLSNELPTEFFPCHRNPSADRWSWYDSGEIVRFATNKLRHGRVDGKAALLLSLSGKLSISDLPSSIDPDIPVYEITLDGMQPGVDFLRRREDLEEFRFAYRALLATLRGDHPRGHAELYLFPAAPAAIALVCGYDRLPKVDPDIVVFDNIRPHGFVERLKVTNHDRI